MSRFESSRFIKDPKVMNPEALKRACDALGWKYTTNGEDLLVTDLGGKDITEVPSHEEVTKAAENAQPTMLAVIKDLVAEC